MPIKKQVTGCRPPRSNNLPPMDLSCVLTVFRFMKPQVMYCERNARYDSFHHEPCRT